MCTFSFFCGVSDLFFNNVLFFCTLEKIFALGQQKLFCNFSSNWCQSFFDEVQTLCPSWRTQTSIFFLWAFLRFEIMMCMRGRRSSCLLLFLCSSNMYDQMVGMQSVLWQSKVNWIFIVMTFLLWADVFTARYCSSRKSWMPILSIEPKLINMSSSNHCSVLLLFCVYVLQAI